MDKEDIVYIYKEYYSATKKNKTTPFAATQMDLETITLSEKVRKRKTSII